MKKDVIYVDIEDDITSVIEKVKNAETNVVALVPPKRIGVLQSVVNLKLLMRAAKANGKHVVMISSNPALTNLVSGVGMPIAKNLQSKPELAEVAALDIDDEDIINGEELPIGDLAATTPTAAQPVEKESIAPVAAATAPALIKKPETTPPTGVKKGSKVPNFERFRKRIFLLVGLGILFIGFLTWAIFFAAHATVTITAKTNAVNINRSLQLKVGATLDANQSVVPAVVKQVKKTNSVDFTASGTKNVGEKATGTVKVVNNTQTKQTVAAGTQLSTAGGLVFTTDSSIDVPGGTVSCNPFPNCQGVPGSNTVTATAAEAGAKYNAANGALTGSPSGTAASFTAPTGGGTDKTVTIVSQDDIDKAKVQLTQQNTDSVKGDLTKQFDSNTIVVTESYTVTAGDPTAAPALGQEATAAKLTAETTYTMVGVARTDLKAVYTTYINSQINGDASQKIYEAGDGNTSFSQFVVADATTYTATATATGQVGPKIDDGTLKTQLVGKRSGEIQQYLGNIQGVENVDTSFSPFWVTSAPGANRITIKFNLKNDDNN